MACICLFLCPAQSLQWVYPVWVHSHQNYMQFGGSVIIFQHFRCRNLALNMDTFPTLEVDIWGGCQHSEYMYAPLCTHTPYVYIHPCTSIDPTYICMPCHTPLYICMFPLYHMFLICHVDLGYLYTPYVLGSFGGISTSVRHFCVCQYIHLPLSS